MQNLKLRALAYLAGWLGCVFAAVAVVQLLAHQFGTEVVMSMVYGGIVLWLLYMVYTLILAKLQWDARVDELHNKQDKQ